MTQDELIDQTIEKTLASFGSLNTPVATAIYDLFSVFLSIFFADIETKREGSNPRDLLIEPSLFTPELWISESSQLQELVSFTSNDYLKIHPKKKESFTKQNHLLFPPQKYNSITLLSGGLDSFCGAYQELKNSTLFVMSMAKTFERGKQKNIVKRLKYLYANKQKLLHIYQYKYPHLPKNEPSQRTRALYFMALGVFIAAIHKADTLNIHENGPFSLHPSYNDRFVTKSTHPKTIYLFNNIIKSLTGLDITVKNPFLFLTKAEIIDLLDDDFRKHALETWSCGKARHSSIIKNKKLHCGICTPCLLRKISILSSKLRDVRENCGEDLFEYNFNTENASAITEYKSSVEYFKSFSNRIDYTLGRCVLKSCYFDIANWDEKLMRMLAKFKIEIDSFFKES